MKNVHALTLLVYISIVLFACEKKNTTDTDKQNTLTGTLQAETSDGLWTASRTWAYFDQQNNSITLSGAMDDSVYFQGQSLHITIDQNTIIIGDTLRDFDAKLLFVIGGDAVAWSYQKTTNSEESYLIIQEFDTDKKRIKGLFKLRLVDARDDDFFYKSLTNGILNMNYEDTNSH